MNELTKAERLKIEAAACRAIGRIYHCSPICCKTPLSQTGPAHEFDIYADGIVIGGVSTSPLKTSPGSRNTGGCDRACSELLWLSLWQGNETRVHVLTDKALAEWLVRRYEGAIFPHSITIYHFDHPGDALHEVGILASLTRPSSAPEKTEAHERFQG
jgi:hypothetical protein